MPTYLVSLEPELSVRVDVYLAEKLAPLSRSQLKQRLNKLLVNGKPAKLSYLVRDTDSIEVELNPQATSCCEPEIMPFFILFEDENCIVLNKQAGIVVHPGAGHASGTIVNGLLYHCKNLKNAFGAENIRPGIVHRLDKETSGVLLTAKNPESHAFFSEQFARRKVKKIYFSLVKGVLNQNSGTIESFIQRDPRERKKFRSSRQALGKRAISHYKVVKKWGNEASLVRWRISTGRTHQIRIHALELGCPIIGDTIYSRVQKDSPPMMLHARSLQIVLPLGEKRTFKADFPQVMKDFVRCLNKKYSRDATKQNSVEAIYDVENLEDRI